MNFLSDTLHGQQYTKDNQIQVAQIELFYLSFEHQMADIKPMDAKES